MTAASLLPVGDGLRDDEELVLELEATELELLPGTQLVPWLLLLSDSADAVRRRRP